MSMIDNIKQKKCQFLVGLLELSGGVLDHVKRKTLLDELGWSEEDFDSIEFTLLQAGYIDGTLGGIEGDVRLTNSGLEELERLEEIKTSENPSNFVNHGVINQISGDMVNSSIQNIVGDKNKDNSLSNDLSNEIIEKIEELVKALNTSAIEEGYKIDDDWNAMCLGTEISALEHAIDEESPQRDKIKQIVKGLFRTISNYNTLYEFGSNIIPMIKDILKLSI